MKKKLAQEKNKLKGDKYLNSIKKDFDSLTLTFSQYGKLSCENKSLYLKNYLQIKNPLYRGHGLKGECSTCLESLIFDLGGEITDIE